MWSKRNKNLSVSEMWKLIPTLHASNLQNSLSSELLLKGKHYRLPVRKILNKGGF